MAPPRKTKIKAAPGKTGPAKPRVQVAALPWRRRADGAVEVLVITSRETRRWVLPKGGLMRGMTPAETAARETFEESGAIGVADPDPIGSYPYDKRLRSGAMRPMQVTVFAMEVTAEQLSWPEKDQRERLWTTPEAAADLVDEPELKALIRAFRP
jgi:8-oxo-dGTP pyrophosphatase MutT (NUDIX family)